MLFQLKIGGFRNPGVLFLSTIGLGCATRQFHCRCLISSATCLLLHHHSASPSSRPTFPVSCLPPAADVAFYSQDRSKLFMHESTKTETPVTSDQNNDRMNGHVLWDAYFKAIQPILEEMSQNKAASKKLKPQDINQVRDFLFLEEEPQTSIIHQNGEHNYREILHSQKEQFLAVNQWNTFQHEFAMRCLTTLVSKCAREKTILPVVMAWSKILKSGIALKPNFLSNLLFVTSLEESYSDISLQVATCHDSLYGPTESSIFLRIKSLVARSDPKGAEALLAELPVRIHASIHPSIHSLHIGCCSAVSQTLSLSTYRMAMARNARGCVRSCPFWSITVQRVIPNQ
jgi:hypothetical protein